MHTDAHNSRGYTAIETIEYTRATQSDDFALY
jgi:hypothetical protein